MVKLAGRALALIAVLAFIFGAQCALSCSLAPDNDACCGHQGPCPHAISGDKGSASLPTLPAVATGCAPVSCAYPAQPALDSAIAPSSASRSLLLSILIL